MLYSNLDHIFENNVIEQILNLDLKDKTKFYKFKRYNKKLDKNHKVNLHSHPGTWLINRESFWKAGGIEERMNGEYGYEDSLLDYCLHEAGTQKVIPNDIIISNDSYSLDITDSDFAGQKRPSRSWNRTPSIRNLKIRDGIIDGSISQSKKYFNFKWIQTYDSLYSNNR